MLVSSRSPNTETLETLLHQGGLVDTHYHVGPELLPRRYNVATLAEAAVTWDATLVLKNHTYSTTPLSALARAKYGVRFIGSVVLNRFVGGLNPDAIVSALSGNRSNVSETDLDDPPIVVWMPTVHAVSHLRVLGHSFDPRWSGCCGDQVVAAGRQEIEAPVEVFDEYLHPQPALLKVLEIVARTGSRLATGHLSASEIMKLIPLALDYGVPAILITHPHYPSVALSDDQLRILTKNPRVFVEHCFAVHTIEDVPLEAIAESIRITGSEQVVIASDFGQICSDPFPSGTIRYAKELKRMLKVALNDGDFIDMFTTNGAKALGLMQK